jgi:DNA-binding GntR family transcriptional regulator
MSRTPVRDAQLKLEAEGLLDVKPGVGLVVREFSADQIVEVYYIREALEGMAAALAAENATPRERMMIRGILEDMEGQSDHEDFQLLRELSGQFHLAVGRGAHNGLLLSMINELQDKFRRFYPSSLTNNARIAKAITELRAILTGIENRDPAEAEAAARRHRRETLQLLLKTLQETDTIVPSPARAEG